MTPSRVRAGLVIALIVVSSALAGAALDRVAARRMTHRHMTGGPGGSGRGSPEQDPRRRNDMLDRMTKELELSTTQRAGIDSVMQRSDSALRAIRTEMQPRLKQVFQGSRVEIEARLDSAQRITFAKSHPDRGQSRP